MNAALKTSSPRPAPLPLRWVPWLLALLLAALFFGTQMPGGWKDAALQAAGMPWQMTKVAHFALFCGIAYLLMCQPLAWRVRWVLLIALALGMLTEGLQFFAIDRHPGWGDVGIDTLGAGLGILLAR